MKPFGKVVDAMQAESSQWFLVCCTCGASRSVADVGGIRFGAASVKKRTLVKCSTCKRLRLAKFERRA